MKGLLQSKIFRKNLKKWLCMYVGALLLLTTVVTYSKYISKYNLDDEARVTKFNVLVEADNACEKTGENIICNQETISAPTEVLTYEFNVTPETEVKTFLALTIHVGMGYEIQKIEDITKTTVSEELYNIEKLDEYRKITAEDNSYISYIAKEGEVGKEPIVKRTIAKINGEETDKIIINRNIDMPANDDKNYDFSNNLKKYRVIVKYKYKEDDYKKEQNDNNIKNVQIIRVDYSATQTYESK